MALGSALVDRAKVITREKVAGEKIDGEVQYTTVEDAKTFRCRLEMQKGSEMDADGRRKSVRRPSLMFRRRDTVTAGDKIHVTSTAIPEGTGVYQVDGDPTPMRRRRRGSCTWTWARRTWT